MTSPEMRRKRWNVFGLHPLLFAAFPFLSFFSANQAHILPGDPTLKWLVLFNLAVAFVVFAGALVGLRDPLRAGLLTSPVVLLFFSYGHLLEPLDGVGIRQPISIGPEKIIGFGFIAITIGLFLLIRRMGAERVRLWSKILAVAGVALAGSSLVAIAGNRIERGDKTEGRRYTTPVTDVKPLPASELPDVYYIVLDAYAREDVLKNILNHDNSWFTDELRAKGFYVAERANANYPHTFFSLPSMLHMKYLNYLGDDPKVNKKSNVLPLLMIDDNQVARVMKALGYKNVVVGSGWFKTKKNLFADIVANSSNSAVKIGRVSVNVDQTSMVYLLNTALKPVIEDRITRGLHREVLKAYDAVEHIATDDDPTFTFAHITIPHPPFLFDSEGNWVGSPAEVAGAQYVRRDPYIEQLEFAGTRALAMIEDILERSEKPPIIVLASDHGSTINLGTPYDWTTPEEMGETAMRERMGILNAYYFPNRDYRSLRPTITPVNTFRLILSQYFGQSYEQLPDRSYFTNYKEFYKFYDVTDIVKESERNP